MIGIHMRYICRNLSMELDMQLRDSENRSEPGQGSCTLSAYKCMWKPWDWINHRDSGKVPEATIVSYVSFHLKITALL